jgi:hypothetical protein
MIKKGNKLYSILNRKCPHCHEGEFMVSRNPYDLGKAGDLLDHCSVCHRKFSTEPGFYYGGMYVSYGLAVALCVSIWVAMSVLAPDSGDTMRLFFVLGGLFILAPVLYAWSKIFWANLFIHYKGIPPVAGENPKWFA